ncbi:MAG: PIN domain nuclease [Alphaproteobacteria bacterium]|nr:MAG: PIN domain nuclease [Alphaproteobacteria bacterium]
MLDTHIALWAVYDSERLSKRARVLIADSSNEIFVSVVSLWEIAIKHAVRRKGRPALPMSAAEARVHFFERAKYAPLLMTADHCCAVEDLPRLTADPFDRLLVAQATVEPMRMLTHDEDLAVYGEHVICT